MQNSGCGGSTRRGEAAGGRGLGAAGARPDCSEPGPARALVSAGPHSTLTGNSSPRLFSSACRRTRDSSPQLRNSKMRSAGMPCSVSLASIGAEIELTLSKRGGIQRAPLGRAGTSCGQWMTSSPARCASPRYQKAGSGPVNRGADDLGRTVDAKTEQSHGQSLGKRSPRWPQMRVTHPGARATCVPKRQRPVRFSTAKAVLPMMRRSVPAERVLA